MRNNIFKFVVMPILIFGLGLGVWFQYTGAFYGSTEDNIKFIQSHLNSSGKLVDLQDEISVKGVDDIKFFFGDKVEIHFGEVLLRWKKDEFLTKEVQKELNKIGITIKVNKKTNKLHLFYHGEEVQRWVS